MIESIKKFFADSTVNSTAIRDATTLGAAGAALGGRFFLTTPGEFESYGAAIGFSTDPYLNAGGTLVESGILEQRGLTLSDFAPSRKFPPKPAAASTNRLVGRS